MFNVVLLSVVLIIGFLLCVSFCQCTYDVLLNAIVLFIVILIVTPVNVVLPRVIMINVVLPSVVLLIVDLTCASFYQST
jgi:hypothetical protein